MLQDAGFNIFSLSTKNAVRTALALLDNPLDATSKTKPDVESIKNGRCEAIDVLDRQTVNKAESKHAETNNNLSPDSQIGWP